MGADEHDLSSRISTLEAALAGLEERMRHLEQIVGAVSAPPVPSAAEPSPAGVFIQSPEPSRPVVVQPAPVPPPRARPPRVTPLPQLSSELELVIGTSWLNRLGIIAIIAAVAYFLKYSFDNNWIGPEGRIALTLLAGLLLLVGGEYYQRRKLPAFAQGLSGGGVAVLYFGVFAAFDIYHLIGWLPAFTTMVLVTIAATLLAIRYDSVAIAGLGLLGGFTTPLLLGGDTTGGGTQTPTPVSPGLYLYFLLLNAGSYVVARRKKWWKFGGAALIAGFLVPGIVASAAIPHPTTAGFYYMALTVATLILSLTLSVPQLAWAALAGGFLIGPWAGVGDLVTRSPLLALSYFGLITVVTILVAERENWRRLAVAAALAGTVTAAFMPARMVAAAVFVYLLVLGGTSLLVTVRRHWRPSGWIILSTGIGATAAIAESTGFGTFAWLPLVGTTLLFLLFSLTAALASRERTEQWLAAAILAAVVYAGQVFLVLGPDRRDELALAAAALAAFHVGMSRVLLQRVFSALSVLVFLGLAITFLTIAIPLKLQQEAIPLAWAVEGAALAWAASRTHNLWAGRAAALVGVLVVLRLVVIETPAIASARLLLSGPGFAFLVGIASLAMSARLLRKVPWPSENERYIAPVLGAAAAALLFWWGHWEIEGAYGRMAGAGATGTRQMTLSAWYGLYGFGLVVAGVLRNVAIVRWAGIGVLGVTILKIFVIDLAEVETVFRILSLLVLGVLLLLASLMYNRYRSRLASPPAAHGGHP